MKRYYVLLVYLILTILFSLACNKRTGGHHIKAISVIDDTTDSFRIKPHADCIIRLLNLSQNKESEVFVTCCTISDRYIIPIRRLHLSEKETTDRQNDGVPMFREKLILKFYDSLKSILSNSDTKGAPLSTSNCFQTIADRLKDLSRLHANESCLVVYGDLQENSQIYNCYHYTSKQPNDIIEDVVRVFDSTHLLPTNLQSIKVVFAYAPRTIQEDRMYLLMFSVYKALLEKRGAIVLQQATDDQFNL